MKAKHLNILFISFWYLLSTAFAQQYNFEAFSVNEGLSQSQVNTIIEDSRGYLWLGTAGGGICKFDGYNFTQYSENDGICGPIVTSIAEDANGNIWFGASWGGVSRFNGKKFQNYTKKEGLISDATTTIMSGSENSLWVGSEEGITIITSNFEFSHLTKENGLINNSINCLFTDSKGKVWIGTDNGISIFRSGSIENIGLNEGLPYSNVTSIAEDTQGRYWIGFERKGAIILIDPKNETKELGFIQVGQGTGLENITVTNILSDNKGIMWLTTNGRGVYKYKDEKLKNYKYRNGLASDVILSICQDRSGSIWFGSSGAGAIKLADETFTYYYNILGLGKSDIFAVTEDDKGNIWVGTATSGAFSYSNDPITNKPVVKQFNETNGLGGSKVMSMIKDSKGNLWFATENGASKFNGTGFLNFTKGNGFPSDQIRSILEDNQGNIWFGTYGNGLIKYNGVSFKTYSTSDGLNHEYIHSMYQDSQGILWFGTGAGVNRFDGKSFTPFGIEDGFCNSYVGSIAEDGYGNMYFGTDRCIEIYDGNEFYAITEEDGLLSNTIYLLIADRDGNIWAGTNKGIDKITLDEYGEIEEIKNYSKEEGFTGIECNSRAVHRSVNGELYFGTVKGLIKYDPSEDDTNFIDPKINVTGIKLFLEEADLLKYSRGSTFWHKLPKELVLPYSMNHLTFEFVGINLKAPENTRYQVKLEGFDKNWSPITFKNEVTYSNTPPGTYTFMVKASDGNGDWSELPATFEFEIDLPFWKTWWFYTLIISSIVFTVYKILQVHTKQLNEMRQNLEEKVTFRTEELKKQKEEKELLLKEVHHRVKNNLQVINSLLSIQSSYIDDEQVLNMFKKSQDRIKAMSLIHEKMYQSSDLAHIDIKEYLNLLSHNLISAYSLDKHITLDIQVSVKKLSIDTLIPMGLIINELVTNSIKYAFEGKSAGKISIFFDVTESRRYKLIVGDNGIGLKDEISLDEPISMGMELIKILVSQIDGEIEQRDQKGTVFKIMFKGLGKDRII